MSTQPRKKRIERQYLDEARTASPVFPVGRYVESERPDFLLYADHRVVGIEVTELCRQASRTENGCLKRVIDNARREFERSADAQAVDVIVAFSPRAKERPSRELTRSLLDPVRVRQTTESVSADWSNGSVGLYERGFLHVGVHSPLASKNQWQGIRAFSTTVAPEELVRSCIEVKNARVSDYRASVDAVWLLIVNDQFLGPGEVYARHEDLTRWTFRFDFDKVLVFSRQPGGTGQVFELQRP
jgi:hypothetical protein